MSKGSLLVGNGTDMVAFAVGSNDQILTADSAQSTGVKWAAGGEVNTASNVGTAGIGVFKQKTGVDLEFKKINAGSTMVTITDDTGNNEVDVDLSSNFQVINDETTWVGYQAGNSITTANDNTLFGYRAGNSITTGNANTMIGNRAGEALTTTESNTFVGWHAGGTDSYGPNTANNNTYIGANAGLRTSSGYGNVILGRDTGINLTTGTKNTILGKAAGLDISTHSDKLRIGNGSMTSTGLIFGDFHTTASSSKVYNGANTTTWNTTSDERVKTNIMDKNTIECLESIKKLKVREFNYRDFWLEHNGEKEDKRQVGLIAQELEKTHPECVNKSDQDFYTREEKPKLLKSFEDLKTVNVSCLIYDLIGAVQQLSKEVEELKR